MLLQYLLGLVYRWLQFSIIFDLYWDWIENLLKRISFLAELSCISVHVSSISCSIRSKYSRSRFHDFFLCCCYCHLCCSYRTFFFSSVPANIFHAIQKILFSWLQIWFKLNFWKEFCKMYETAIIDHVPLNRSSNLMKKTLFDENSNILQQYKRLGTCWAGLIFTKNSPILTSTEEI